MLSFDQSVVGCTVLTPCAVLCCLLQTIMAEAPKKASNATASKDAPAPAPSSSAAPAPPTKSSAVRATAAVVPLAAVVAAALLL